MAATSPFRSDHLQGALCGLTAVLIWSGYLSYTRLGMVDGLHPADIVFLRYSVAGAILLPWLVAKGWRDLGGVGWWRGAALALSVGPLFILTASAGFLYAPLSHGAVIQPSTAALSSIIAAWLLLKEPFSGARIAGSLIIVLGISLIAYRSMTAPSGEAWIGDLLFVAAGLFWMVFTILIRLWSIPGLPATAAASVLSALVVVPAFLAFDTFERLAALPAGLLIVQIFVQGVLSGVVAIVAFGRAVTLLGASGAALFPAVVPAATLIVGIPVTGEIPTALGWAGAALATAGLAIAMGVGRGKVPGNKLSTSRAR